MSEHDDVTCGLRLLEPGNSRRVALERRAPSPREVAVAVGASAVSVGSAMALYEGRVHPVSFPASLGYEAVGMIVARGAEVADRELGDRVVVTAAHDDWVVVEASKTIVMPAEISDAAALLLVLACDADSGIVRTGISAGASVVVTGAGALGLLTVFGLRRRGIDVEVVEPKAARRELARTFGARRVASPSEASSWPDSSFDHGFECSDEDAAFGELQRLVAPRGTLAVIADGNLGSLTLGPHFHDKELSVLGCSDEPRYSSFASEYLAALRAGWEERLVRLFDRRVVASELPELFEAMAENPATRPLKVLVEHGPEARP